MKIFFISSVIAFFLGGCSSAMFAPDGAVSLRGVYLHEFEREEFMACDGGRYLVINPQVLKEEMLESRSSGMPLEIQGLVQGSQSVADIQGYDSSIRVIKVRRAESGAGCEALLSRQK